MDKMIVDPELFITCRLCLIQKGQYQIVPSVQQQIKFCFDIDVQPFDGLPQLICTDCEGILCNVNEIKTKFQERQTQLKLKVSKCPASINANSSILQEQNVVTSTEQTDDRDDEEVSKYTKFDKNCQIPTNEKKDTQLVSDSCASNHSDNKKKKRKKSHKHSKNWSSDYEKLFVCRYCSSCFMDKKSIFDHHKEHEELLSRYKLKNCSVLIPKSDGKVNITGLQDAVVLHKDRILQNSNKNYNIIFIHKVKSNTNVEKDNLSDSSNDNMNVNRKGKKLRLLSQSSNETIVLEGSVKQSIIDTEVIKTRKSDQKTTVIEYVDIGDSAESDLDKKLPQTSTKSCSRNRNINNTVASCLYKYINKNNSSENHKKESLLIHKVLSVGTKFINKKEFNCTGLLRFLEYKNLNVIWAPRPNNNNQCVRILTKLKEPVANDSDIGGWKKLSTITKAKEIPLHDLLDKMYSYEASFSICNVSPSTSTFNAITDQATSILHQAVITIPKENESQLKILLNQNPVPNPKQLPKKQTSQSNQNLKVVSGNCIKDADQNTMFHMPIITQSVSLAGLPQAESFVESTSVCSTSNTSDNVSQPFQQRIKVKSASQLMAGPSTDISSSSVPIWNTPVTSSGIPASDVIDSTCYNDTENTIQSRQHAMKPVIMHTVELPNTKTLSPFLYFKKLLQIHNILLYDSNELISNNYVCLIKFKSIFNQDNDKTVTLGLGLFSDSVNFAMKLKDMNTLIDITTLLPRWQWEVIQLYKGDEIVSKLRNNAMRIGQNMLERTNYFISLLNCIIFSDLS